MKVTVWGPNLGVHDEQIHLHKTGCADTKRGIYRRHTGDEWNLDAASLQEIVHEIYPPDNFDYDADAEWRSYADDVKVFPCVIGLPDEVAH